MGKQSAEIEQRIVEQRRQTELKIQKLKHRVSNDVLVVKEDTRERTQQLKSDSEDAMSTAKGYFNLRGDNMLVAGLAIGFVTGFMNLETGMFRGGNGHRPLTQQDMSASPPARIPETAATGVPAATDPSGTGVPASTSAMRE